MPELHRPQTKEYTITIEVESAINHPAYFDPPLNDTFPLAVTRTYIEQYWEVTLPPLIDPENKTVELSV